MSLSFGVSVHGFANELFWCIASDGTGTVVTRGLTRIGAPASGQGSGCAGFQQDITTLAPTMHSYAGAPAAAPKPEAAP